MNRLVAVAFLPSLKNPPVAIQLLEVAKVKSGSAEPNRKKVAELTFGTKSFLQKKYWIGRSSRTGHLSVGMNGICIHSANG